MWEQLCLTRRLTIRACSQGPSGTWSRHGSGQVSILSPDLKTLVFQESGNWLGMTSSPIPFTNTYQWENQSNNRISLSHLRYGKKNPVYLFTFSKIHNGLWRSDDAHQCALDHYSAEAVITQDAVYVNWTITGPKKNDSLRYGYLPE